MFHWHTADETSRLRFYTDQLWNSYAPEFAALYADTIPAHWYPQPHRIPVLLLARLGYGASIRTRTKLFRRIKAACCKRWLAAVRVPVRHLLCARSVDACVADMIIAQLAACFATVPDNEGMA
jgi:hypothetical protein